MNYPNSKKEVTALVLKELPDDASNVWKELTLDTVLWRWWQTGRGGPALRLTEQGMEAFQVANIACYEFPIDLKQPAKEWTGLITKLTKKLACPYYLGVRNTSEGKRPFIKIYDHKIAMMISLYGDLDGYLDSVK